MLLQIQTLRSLLLRTKHSPPSRQTYRNISIEQQDPDGVATIIAYHVLDGTNLSSAVTEVSNYVSGFFKSAVCKKNLIREWQELTYRWCSRVRDTRPCSSMCGLLE
jgi:hypothetical protein